MRRRKSNRPYRHSYLLSCGMACLRKILMNVWVAREAVQTRVSESATMALAHLMSGEKVAGEVGNAARDGGMKPSSRTSNHKKLRFRKSKRLEVQAQADAKKMDGERPTSCIRHTSQMHGVHSTWIHQTLKRGPCTTYEKVSEDSESVAPWTMLYSR